MNPEIRFRVPTHIHHLASRKAEELGLRSRKGLTGGAAELARCALYTLLGLGLPEGTDGLSRLELHSVENARRDLESEPEDSLCVTVHHRIDLDYRKQRALEGQNVPLRQTTEFRFPRGELPDFLVPYVLLTDHGRPFVALNLEGSTSPRRDKPLAELFSSSEQATLTELRDCLQAHQSRLKAREKERALREEQLLRGTKILSEWLNRNGSNLLRERHRGGFEWVDLAAREYAMLELKKLGIEDATPLPTTSALSGSPHRFRDPRPQTRPQESTLVRLKELKDISDSGLELSVVLVVDSETNTTLEALQLSVRLPVPGRLHFLTSAVPAHNE